MSRRDRAPRARRKQLVIKELATETLVYDESNHQAHCLNQTAAFVWKHCDGRTDVPVLARLLREEIKVSVPEPIVRLAIKQLEESHLLETSSRNVWIPQTSRRELVRRIGIAAVALLIISSITTANAAAAGSCRALTQSCTGVGQGTCCTGLVCCGGTCFTGPTCP